MLLETKKNKTISAKGIISIKNKDYKLKADEIVYHIDKKKLMQKEILRFFKKTEILFLHQKQTFQ